MLSRISGLNHRVLKNISSLKPVLGNLSAPRYVHQNADPQLSYSERQRRLNRPVSPHTTIYKFPVTAISSITNRITGVVLSVGIYGIAALSLFDVNVASLFSTIGQIYFLSSVAKFVVSFPVIYHFLGGLRHIYWDKNPESLTNEEVEKTSYAVIGTSLALSLGASLV